jgi:hypothetical protein
MLRHNKMGGSGMTRQRAVVYPTFWGAPHRPGFRADADDGNCAPLEQEKIVFRMTRSLNMKRKVMHEKINDADSSARFFC